MGFGTVEVITDGVPGYEYRSSLNPLLAQHLVRVTVAPFGRPIVNRDIDNSEYATVEAATAFARVLHAEILDAASYEAATFTTSYPKYILTAGAYRVNAGAIASIIGNDPGCGTTPAAKAGHLADILGEQYDAEVHVPLMTDLIAAAKEIVK